MNYQLVRAKTALTEALFVLMLSWGYSSIDGPHTQAKTTFALRKAGKLSRRFRDWLNSKHRYKPDSDQLAKECFHCSKRSSRRLSSSLFHSQSTLQALYPHPAFMARKERVILQDAVWPRPLLKPSFLNRKQLTSALIQNVWPTITLQ